MKKVLFMIMICAVASLYSSCQTQTPNKQKPISKQTSGIPDWAKMLLSKEQIAAARMAGVLPAIEVDLGKGVSVRMLFIPSGNFMMGSMQTELDQLTNPLIKDVGNAYLDEIPRHKVIISKGFYMCVTEITREQFRRFIEDSGYKTDAEKLGISIGINEKTWTFERKEGLNWKNPGVEQTENHPAVHISWNDAKEFITWLNRKSGKDYYSLPSEAEWEYACRGGTGGQYFFGDKKDNLFMYANYADRNTNFSWSDKDHNDGYRFTAQVGTYKPNSWGLYDMSGNAREWCEDDYHENYFNAPVNDKPWVESPRLSRRVLKGSCCYGFPEDCRITLRGAGLPNSGFDINGFRFVKSLPK